MAHALGARHGEVGAWFEWEGWRWKGGEKGEWDA
jgi:hypothetical protein